VTRPRAIPKDDHLPLVGHREIEVGKIELARAIFAVGAEAGVARRTVIRLEKSEEPRSERIMEKLRGALEKRGIEFLFEGRHGVGLRYRGQTKSGST